MTAKQCFTNRSSQQTQMYDILRSASDDGALIKGALLFGRTGVSPMHRMTVANFIGKQIKYRAWAGESFWSKVLIKSLSTNRYFDNQSVSWSSPSRQCLTVKVNRSHFARESANDLLFRLALVQTRLNGTQCVSNRTCSPIKCSPGKAR